MNILEQSLKFSATMISILEEKKKKKRKMALIEYNYEHFHFQINILFFRACRYWTIVRLKLRFERGDRSIKR